MKKWREYDTNNQFCILIGIIGCIMMFLGLVFLFFGAGWPCILFWAFGLVFVLLMHIFWDPWG